MDERSAVNVFTIITQLWHTWYLPYEVKVSNFPIFTLNISFSEKIFWGITEITQINHRSSKTFKNFMGSPCDPSVKDSIIKSLKKSHLARSSQNRNWFHKRHLNINFWYFLNVVQKWKIFKHCTHWLLRKILVCNLRRSFSLTCDSVRVRSSPTHMWTFWQCWSVHLSDGQASTI